MKKIILFFLFLSLGIFTKSQSFPYTQDWGTYVGGVGTQLLDYTFEGNSFSKDSQNNIYFNGTTNFGFGNTASYYNQFVTGGGNTADMTINSNLFSSNFTINGILTKSGYISSGSLNNEVENFLAGIDGANNKYYLKRQSGQVANLATPNVWLTQNTDITSNFSYTLSKFDSNQNLLWTTYLPNNLGSFFIRTDENQNVFIIGVTDEEITNLATPNVFQENFISYIISSTAVDAANSFLVKLDASGQKLWATYSVSGIQDVAYYYGALYSSSSYDANMPGTLTTSGAFQTAPSQQMLMKIDANTGQKIWSTFYGTPNLQGFIGVGIYDIEVNQTGLYVSGQTEDAAYPTYFATTGAFKNQLTGGGDLFLSKFDLSGNRIWSTYFGSSGYDTILGSANMSILGGRIVISGNQYGNSSNIATPGSFLATPSNASVDNMFFAEFDSFGNRQWCSYFGGVGSSAFGNYIMPELLSDDSLILWGHTGAQTGIATSNGAYPTMTTPVTNEPFGFVTRFVLRNPELGTSEAKLSGLNLYDNPNNGNFYISGSILRKENFVMSIYDSVGRLIKKQKLSHDEKQYFNFENVLSSGNYFVVLSNKNDEKHKTFKIMVHK